MSCSPTWGPAPKEVIRPVVKMPDNEVTLNVTTVLAHFTAVKSQLDTLTKGQEMIHVTLQEMTEHMLRLKQPEPVKPNRVTPSKEQLTNLDKGSVALAAKVEDTCADTSKDVNSEIKSPQFMPAHTFVHDLEEEAPELPHDQKLLTELILAGEHEEMRLIKQHNTPCLERLRNVGKQQLDTGLDIFIALMITSNAVWIGISVDKGADDNSIVWTAIDVIFSVIFLCELIIKVRMNGFYGHFCGVGTGRGVLSNWFDFIDSPSSSLFRVLRLARLGRILRLLRLEALSDLTNMMTGITEGILTLTWAWVVFAIIVYVFALVFRETIGKQPLVEGVSDYFATVPRTMFTVFRCAFGDCSTASGQPLFELVEVAFGIWASRLVYVVLVWFVMIGLFNIISAIFVESTMAAAARNDAAERQKRFSDEGLWSTRIVQLIRVIVGVTCPDVDPNYLSEFMDSVLEVSLSSDDFRKVVLDERAIRALDELDIKRADHQYLPDILDPDNGGSLSIAEIVDGLMRLRGDPRRSDIVAIDLMVRSLQAGVGNFQHSVDHLGRHIEIGLERLIEGQEKLITLLAS